MATKLSQQLKDILIKLAIADKLPLDMGGFDTKHFDKVIEKYEAKNKMVGGITVFDIEEYAKEENIKLKKGDAENVLKSYDDNYMCSGEGLHGTELIQYCLEELGLD